MSYHTDKIEKHPVYTNLKNIENELKTIEEMQDKPPMAVEALARIAMVVKNLSVSLEACDKNLMAITWLDESSKALVNMKSYLSSYKSNRDANLLINNCAGQLDTLLQESAKLNCVKSTKSLRGIITAGNEYRQIMDSQNRIMSDKVNSLKQEIEENKKEIEKQIDWAKNKLTDFQNSIGLEKKRLDELSTLYHNQMMEDQKNFLGMTESLKNSFTKVKETCKEDFNKEVEKASDKIRNISENAALREEELKSEGHQFIEEYRHQFETYKLQVEKIVGIVNSNVFSFSYKKVADDAHKRARLWHRIAIAFMIIVGIFAIYAFVITVNSDTSWVNLVAKIFATTTFVTSAAYAARQASKQERVERYARKIEVELTAIDPFINSLDSEKQSQIKEELARKLFGNADTMEINSKDEPYTAMDNLTLTGDTLKTFLNYMMKISK